MADDFVDVGDWTSGEWSDFTDPTYSAMLDFSNAGNQFTIDGMSVNDWFDRARGQWPGQFQPSVADQAAPTGGVDAALTGSAGVGGGSGGAGTTVMQGGGGTGGGVARPFNWTDAGLRAALSLGIGGAGLGISRALAPGSVRLRTPALTALPQTPGNVALDAYLRSPAGAATLTRGLGGALTGQADLASYLNRRLATGETTAQATEPYQQAANIAASQNARYYALGQTVPGLETERSTQTAALGALEDYLKTGGTQGTAPTDAMRRTALGDITGYLGGTPIPGTADAAGISSAARAGLLKLTRGEGPPGAEDMTALGKLSTQQLNDYLTTGVVPLDPLMTDVGKYARGVLEGTTTSPVLDRAYREQQDILNNELGRRGMTGEASRSSPNLYARALLAENQGIGRYTEQQSVLSKTVPQYERAIQSGVTNRRDFAALSDAILNRLSDRLLKAAQYGDTVARDALADRQSLVRLADEATARMINASTANASRYDTAALGRIGTERGFLGLGLPNAGLTSSVEGSMLGLPMTTGQGVNVPYQDVLGQRGLEAGYGTWADEAKIRSRQSLADAAAGLFTGAAGAAVGSGGPGGGRWVYQIA